MTLQEARNKQWLALVGKYGGVSAAQKRMDEIHALFERETIGVRDTEMFIYACDQVLSLLSRNTGFLDLEIAASASSAVKKP